MSSRLCLHDQLLSAVPALLLVTVASVHVWRWHHEPVSAWRGGGFGMYATVNDQRGRRVSLLALDGHGQWQQIEPPRTLRHVSDALTLHPSRTALRAYGEAAACSAELRQAQSDLTALKVDYRELTFDPERFTVTNTLKESVRLDPCP
ncbi:hypothetical protein [Deinococcus xianganensis]|uniref:Uncharacterized protein n=1 Tax=Deinococcus xianganensis TaxID=1507289 RepID=A0A6I4YLS6_9DEIO|nr:hypothetical protein [Deinococcus xianganensis]MXV19997.1 hypothetical protein [Deinococcus xianganensis]